MANDNRMPIKANVRTNIMRLASDKMLEFWSIVGRSIRTFIILFTF